MALNIQINLAVLIATVVGEVVSAFWQSDVLPWGRYEDHYLVSSVCSSFALAVILQWITSHHWGVRKWQDGLWLSVCVTLVYAALTAPATVYGPKSLIALCFMSIHKFVVIFVMTLALYFVRKQGY